MRGWFLPVISRPGVGTMLALEIPFPRAAATASNLESQLGPPRRRQVPLPPAVSSTAAETVVRQAAPESVDDEVARMLALIGGYGADSTSAVPDSTAHPPEQAVPEEAAVRVLVVEDDAFVLSVACGARRVRPCVLHL